MNLLRSERLLRARGASEGEELETYHDRIRESVVALLPESRLEISISLSFGAQPDARRATLNPGGGWRTRLAAMTTDA